MEEKQGICAMQNAHRENDEPSKVDYPLTSRNSQSTLMSKSPSYTMPLLSIQWMSDFNKSATITVYRCNSIKAAYDTLEYSVQQQIMGSKHKSKLTPKLISDHAFLPNKTLNKRMKLSSYLWVVH